MKLYLPTHGHLRVFFRHDKDHNGTVAYAAPPMGGPVAQALARVHEADHFCKATGRRIALTRLCKALNLSRPERKQVWAAYFQTHSDLRRAA